jgi:prepilin-type N-terminal cleavage/methylation domain-containing protein
MRDHRSAFPHREFLTRKSGFTLLEVLVALAVLGIALVVIFQLFSADLKGLATSDDYANAVIKAESKMREILDDDTLSEKTWSEATEDGYRIDAVVTEAVAERTENLQVKLLEINLAVHWRSGLRNRTITLKTMKLVNKPV